MTDTPITYTKYHKIDCLSDQFFIVRNVNDFTELISIKNSPCGFTFLIDGKEYTCSDSIISFGDQFDELRKTSRSKQMYSEMEKFVDISRCVDLSQIGSLILKMERPLLRFEQPLLYAESKVHNLKYEMDGVITLVYYS